MQILNAVTQYTSEEGHSITGLGTISTDCTTPTNVTVSQFGGLPLVDEYIVAIPKDPQAPTGTPDDTGYDICITGTTGRVQVMAPLAEGKTISVKR
jgi:hypothetical protein